MNTQYYVYAYKGYISQNVIEGKLYSVLYNANYKNIFMLYIRL